MIEEGPDDFDVPVRRCQVDCALQMPIPRLHVDAVETKGRLDEGAEARLACAQQGRASLRNNRGTVRVRLSATRCGTASQSYRSASPS